MTAGELKALLDGVDGEQDVELAVDGYIYGVHSAEEEIFFEHQSFILRAEFFARCLDKSDEEN
jgi:hypothetical protein